MYFYSKVQLKAPGWASISRYIQLVFCEDFEDLIELYKNDTFLNILRIKIQPLIYFLSNIAVSIVGILGDMGFIMNLL